MNFWMYSKMNKQKIPKFIQLFRERALILKIFDAAFDEEIPDSSFRQWIQKLAWQFEKQTLEKVEHLSDKFTSKLDPEKNFQK